jgi:hypothetical protein
MPHNGAGRGIKGECRQFLEKRFQSGASREEAQDALLQFTRGKDVSKGWRSQLVTSVFGTAASPHRRATCAAAVAPEDRSWHVYGGSMALPRPVRFHHVHNFTAVPAPSPTEAPRKGILNTGRRRARMSSPLHPRALPIQAAPATPIVWTKPERKRARISDDVTVLNIEKKEAFFAFKSLLWFSSQEREANRWHAMRGLLPDMP